MSVNFQTEKSSPRRANDIDHAQEIGRSTDTRIAVILGKLPVSKLDAPPAVGNLDAFS